jgi:Protein of unknown function (DUF1329)
MQYHRLTLTAALGAALLATGLSHAKVAEQEAARLGKDLTPFGAEVAGSADGTIPEWSGKWRGVPPGVDYPGHPAELPSPYPDEKPLFSITAANYEKYKEHLTEGQIALLKRYPTFRMDIYPSHRDFNFSERMIEKASWNARNTVLSNGVESVSHYTGGIPFPIPGSAEEVMWNTRANYCHHSAEGAVELWGVFANGERSLEVSDFTQSLPFNNPANPIPTTEEVVGDRMAYTFTSYTAPARKKGEAIMVQDPVDYKANKRNAWIYRPDIRRVRKAPAIAYDNPVPPGGLMTTDDQKGFNGAFDRYTYELLGKREIFIPYNNYGFNDPSVGEGSVVESRLTVNHVNPDYVRFEKHRVWVVEAKLAPGKRHIYKQRRWYIDEDSWNPVMTESFDSRDNLWRVGFMLSEYQYDIECQEKHAQIFMDLPSGHYVVSFSQLELEPFDYSGPFRDKSYFTPANLRQSVKR